MDELSPDFDLDAISAELAEQLPGDGADPGPELSETDREAGWSIKRKEPAAEAEPKSIEKELEQAFAEQTATAADGEASSTWDREHRRLADEAIRRHGVDPADRHAAGISRREATRRLYRAEAALRSDPVNALAGIAHDYTAQLEPSAKESAARAILAQLGFDGPDGLDQAARQRLAQYDQQHQARVSFVREAIPRLQQQIEAFRSSHPDFDQLRPVMSAMIAGGEARTIEDAYTLARRARGLPDAQAEATHKADEARRSKVANARNAGTPQTKSAPTRREPVTNDPKSINDTLEDAWDAAFGTMR